MISNFKVPKISTIGKIAMALILISPLSGQADMETLPHCIFNAGVKPVNIPAVSKDLENIEHIFILMQENHSFDQYLGQLSRNVYYGTQIDGLKPDPVSEEDYRDLYLSTKFDALKPWYTTTNKNLDGKASGPYHANDTCPADPNHEWNAAHISFNRGLNDGFVKANGVATLGYYGPETLPFLYSVANEFSVGDRFFSSMIGPTIPNRTYLYAGTSAGLIVNNIGISVGFNANSRVTQPKLIWQLLNENRISWGYYADTAFGQFNGYTSMFKGNIIAQGLPGGQAAIGKLGSLNTFRADLKSGKLPKIVFVDGMNPDENEHPADRFAPTSDLREGHRWLEMRVREIVGAAAWAKSAIFITYDENGGFADHVVPPKACQPDKVVLPATPKDMKPEDVYNASFDQYGFRVPFVMISPFAKRHYISHTVYDHTSILKFIETRYHLPALTARDANANDMLDLFDFSSPPNTQFLVGKPAMLSPKPGENGTTKCAAVPFIPWKLPK